MSSDCCKWDGVTCDQLTGDVIGLDLSCSQLVGVLHSNSSLFFQLPHLQRLDLAFNDFSGSMIPREFGRFATSLTHLNLSYSNISGPVPLEISHLSKLVSLDLSYNYNLILNDSNTEFQFLMFLLQNLTQLRHLSLASVPIDSVLPKNLSSFCSLTFLDLSGTRLRGELPHEIFFLPNLKTLNLHYNPNANLSRLVYLDLSYNLLMGPLPSNIIGLQKLTHLCLSGNSLSGTIPSWVFDLALLKVLDLGSNQFKGQLSEFQLKSNSLEAIVLSDNELSGSVPRSIFQHVDLHELDLSRNKLSGILDIEMFSSLKKLETLSLSYNNNLSVRLSTTNKTMINATFPNLKSLELSSLKIKEFPYFLRAMENLESLDLSNNQIHGRVPEWVSSKWRDSLQILDLSSNFLEESIHLWICNSTNLGLLNLSSNNFSGVLPHCLGNLSDSLLLLDLSINHFHSTIPSTFANLNKLKYLNLGSNLLEESIPLWICSFTSLEYINLSSNNFGGVLPHSLGNLSDSLFRLDLSMNQFCGTIPSTFANLSNLQILNLHGNQFEGVMPSLGNCTYLWTIDLGSNKLKDTFPRWMETLAELNVLILRSNEFYGPISTSNVSKTKYPFSDLLVMDLSNNEFRGEIPNVFGTFQFLEDLDLHDNHFQGVVPSSLANCAELEVLNLGKNQINDIFPNWLETLPKLHVLILSFNRFYGPISTNSKNKIRFPKLRIIDLSCNEFSGLLPELFFKNFRAMVSVDENKKEPEYVGGNGYYHSSVVLVMKGVNMEIERILTTLITIDLSSNKFKGDIPYVIGNLKFLRQLNLSHNSLVGRIPSLLGNLSVLESLDLNSNQFVGEIPQELANLNFLEKLNLSHNQLRGRIPSGAQLNTFSNDSYYGNVALCGFPLSNCENGEMLQLPILQEENDSDFFGGFTWKAVLMGYGCGTVLGFVIGYIMFLVGKPKWFIGIVEGELRRKVRSPRRRGFKHCGRRN